ncbi:PSMC3 interacting protein [Conglomerata obtusa]
MTSKQASECDEPSNNTNSTKYESSEEQPLEQHEEKKSVTQNALQKENIPEKPTKRKAAVKKTVKKADSQSEKPVKPVNNAPVNNKLKALLLDFLLSKTRPYPLTELLLTFKKEGVKQDIMNALNDLAQEGSLIKKEYGKAILYLGFKQQSNMSEEEINVLKNDVSEINKKCNAVKVEVKKVKDEMSKLCEYPKNDEMKKIIKTKLEEVEKNKQRIEDLSGGKLKVEKTDMEKVDKELNKYRKILKERKEIHKNIFDVMLDNSGMKKDELMEEMGLED